ncbi:MAG: hypothetical protein DYG98_15550 [Haliscomenobacteraceae bacterium CHB4]|nr:hypothetical protein [Saprospiraceae bacterium]MCE7924461.1 hypothetical protein [Haliscomenobacteraceae bacterium CHB4]
MDDSVLVVTLRALLPAHKQKLLDFFSSKFLNRGKNAPVREKLLRYLVEHIAKGKNSLLEKLTVCQAVFGLSEPDTAKLDSLMNEVLELVRKMIAWQKFEKETGTARELVYLAGYYQENDLVEKGFSALHRAQKLLHNPGELSLNQYYDHYLLWKATVSLKSYLHLRRDDLDLPHAIRAFDTYYIAERLYLCCLLLSQSRLVKIDTSLYNIFRDYQTILHLNYSFEDPLIGILEQIASFLSAPTLFTREELSALRLKIRAVSFRLDPGLLTALEMFICNLCIARVNANEWDFLPDLFELQKERVESGRIYTDGMLSPSEYQSITVAGLRLGEMDWTLQFIEENKLRILGYEQSLEPYKYNIANYLFYNKDYEKCLDHLQEGHYEDHHYKVWARILELKVYYETIPEIVASKLSAAKMFFHRDELLPDEKKTLFNTFVDVLKQMVSSNTLGNEKRIKRILQKVKTTPYIAERYWLTEKLEEMLKKARKTHRAA